MLLTLMRRARIADVWQLIDFVRYMMLFCILFRETIRDIREREIDIGMPIAYGITVLLLNLIPRHGDIIGCIGGALLGGVVLLFTVFKKESIGAGDGIIFIVTGAALGTYLNLVLILRAMLLAGIGAIILVIIGKRRNLTIDTMPLMPYILLSYLSICVSCV